MQTLDCIRSRRSVRKFKDRVVEFAKVGSILEAGSLAPSAGNLQDWKFILVLDDKKREQIAEACVHQMWMSEAPVHVVVCSEKQSGKFYGERGDTYYSIQNCAAVVENMILAANDQGLGSCWVSAFDDKKLRSLLSIPDKVVPQAVVVVGYANEKPKEPPRHSLENVTYIESWDNRIRDKPAFQGYYAHYTEQAIEAGKKFVKNILEKVKPK
jgi:nitroreductase